MPCISYRTLRTIYIGLLTSFAKLIPCNLKTCEKFLGRVTQEFVQPSFPIRSVFGVEDLLMKPRTIDRPRAIYYEILVYALDRPAHSDFTRNPLAYDQTGVPKNLLDSTLPPLCGQCQLQEIRVEVGTVYFPAVQPLTETAVKDVDACNFNTLHSYVSALITSYS